MQEISGKLIMLLIFLFLNAAVCTDRTPTADPLYI